MRTGTMPQPAGVRSDVTTMIRELEHLSLEKLQKLNGLLRSGMIYEQLMDTLRQHLTLPPSTTTQQNDATIDYEATTYPSALAGLNSAHEQQTPALNTTSSTALQSTSFHRPLLPINLHTSQSQIEMPDASPSYNENPGISRDPLDDDFFLPASKFQVEPIAAPRDKEFVPVPREKPSWRCCSSSTSVSPQKPEAGLPPQEGTQEKAQRSSNWCVRFRRSCGCRQVDKHCSNCFGITPCHVSIYRGRFTFSGLTSRRARKQEESSGR